MQKVGEFKVGGIIYEVRLVDDLIMKFDALGLCHYPSATIDIDASLPADRMSQVIAHELLHAIFNEAGYDDQDEDLINRVGIVFSQFLADNFVHVSLVPDEGAADLPPEKKSIGYDTKQEDE